MPFALFNPCSPCCAPFIPPSGPPPLNNVTGCSYIVVAKLPFGNNSTYPNWNSDLELYGTDETGEIVYWNHPTGVNGLRWAGNRNVGCTGISSSTFNQEISGVYSYNKSFYFWYGQTTNCKAEVFGTNMNLAPSIQVTNLSGIYSTIYANDSKLTFTPNPYSIALQGNSIQNTDACYDNIWEPAGYNQGAITTPNPSGVFTVIVQCRNDGCCMPTGNTFYLLPHYDYYTTPGLWIPTRSFSVFNSLTAIPMQYESSGIWSSGPIGTGNSYIKWRCGNFAARGYPYAANYINWPSNAAFGQNGIVNDITTTNEDPRAPSVGGLPTAGVATSCPTGCRLESLYYEIVVSGTYFDTFWSSGAPSNTPTALGLYPSRLPDRINTCYMPDNYGLPRKLYVTVLDNNGCHSIPSGAVLPMYLTQFHTYRSSGNGALFPNTWYQTWNYPSGEIAEGYIFNMKAGDCMSFYGTPTHLHLYLTNNPSGIYSPNAVYDMDINSFDNTANNIIVSYNPIYYETTLFYNLPDQPFTTYNLRVGVSE